MSAVSRQKTLLLSGLVFSGLIAGMFLLVPQGADATKVLLTPTGVSGLASTYAFQAQTTVQVPANERAPLEWVRVLVDDASSSTFAAGKLSSPFCDTAVTSGASANITSIQAPAGSYAYGATRTNTRFQPTVVGGQYDFDAGTSVNYGYGYGYGSTVAITVTVSVQVTGCLSSAKFASGPAQDFDIQVFLGADASRNFPSLPVRIQFFDPNFVAPTTPSTQATFDVGVPTAEAGQTSLSFMAVDNDGDATPFEPIAAGTEITATFPDGLGAVSGITFTAETQSQLPSGTQIQITTSEAPTGATPFGINPAVLGTVVQGKNPAIFFQVRLTQPGSAGFVDATPLLDMEVSFEVGNEYFSANQVAPGRLRLSGFDASGNLKPIQPQFLGAQAIAGGGVRFTFRITSFSSFAAYATPAPTVAIPVSAATATGSAASSAATTTASGAAATGTTVTTTVTAPASTVTVTSPGPAPPASTVTQTVTAPAAAVSNTDAARDEPRQQVSQGVTLSTPVIAISAAVFLALVVAFAIVLLRRRV
jgi:hypothetical protein